MSSSRCSRTRDLLFFSTALSPATIPFFIPLSGDGYSWMTSDTQTRSAFGVLRKIPEITWYAFPRFPAGRRSACATGQNTRTACDVAGLEAWQGISIVTCTKISSQAACTSVRFGRGAVICCVFRRRGSREDRVREEELTGGQVFRGGFLSVCRAFHVCGGGG